MSATESKADALTELQRIQHQLDNSASVEEVLASDTLVRIDGFLFGLHHMVGDPSGSVAVIRAGLVVSG